MPTQQRSPSVDQTIETLNRWLLLLYLALTLVLWVQAGPSMPITALAVSLALLHSASFLLYRQPGPVRRLAAVAQLLEIGLLLLVSMRIERELSTILLSITSAGIVLRYPAWMSLPAVLGGFTLYLSVVQPDAWAQGNAALRLLGFAIWVVAFFGVRRLLVQRQQILDLNQHIQSQAALTTEMARLRERNRLAEEMHDTIGHTLTSAIVSLEGASLLLARRPDEAATLLDSARTQLQNGLGDLRQAVRNLRTDGPSEHMMLRESLGHLVAQVARQTSVQIVVHHRVEADLVPIQEYVLFAVAREGITNALRHGRPSAITLALDAVEPACVALSVTDDGLGASRPDPGFGLTHLRQKVEALGGTLQIDSGPRAGFRLSVLMPLTLPGRAVADAVGISPGRQA
ncbi:MAG TPA: sensor histidine kinase [Chloroflexaceae bacterium]|nr:sensor histidine kinase [Chloroflexaceae bacterium]